MYDFSERINLQNMKNSSLLRNGSGEEYIKKYLLDLYGRVLQLCYKYNKTIEAIRIQQEYFGEYVILPKIEYSDKGIQLEKKILSKLPINKNYELDRKEDKIAVTNFLLQEYKQMLNKELLNSSKENLLMLFYSISSMISYISMGSAYLFKHKAPDAEEKDINIQNMIIDTIGLIHSEAELEIGSILGVEKKSCEYLIGLILNEDLDYPEEERVTINIDNIFLFTDKIIYTLVIKKSINNLSHYGVKFRINENNLCFDDDFKDKLKLYSETIYNSSVDINSSEANAIFLQFEKKEGYSIKILEDYIKKIEGKYLNIQHISNIVEDKLLYYDMHIATGANVENIKKIIQAISLRKPEGSLEDAILSTDNRVFRAPIIKVDNYFIVSYYMLVEASHYLRYRILRKELSNDGNLKKQIKKLYDEKELKDLKELIMKYGVPGDVSFELESKKELKSLFKEKGITKELDFYFVYNKTLYTMEYKNQDIDRNIFEISKSYSRNKSNINKHLRLVDIIRKNKSLFEKVLAIEFTNIKSFLVFKYKNSFSDFYRGNDIFSCSYNEFYDWCKELICYDK
ncbi:hypothetical protein [Maledivibacter halophilus]|uniref:Uncharacterized protein n=1 Tax=Maledivibacter halophilus TaxID=36842 RepID=A0A1T5KSJ3_9FIRM|nr:hypothetical protein [Maledivibacter halophilus]SKC66369.1 hypothetical protein SAMN02194393_02102 [Maledivibacter halophilus]